VHVLNILRRVAIALALVITGVFSWIRRMENGSPNGRVTTASVVIAAKGKGEALVPGRLGQGGPSPDIEITPGKRAMSFRVNDVSGIATIVEPNSRVDLVVVVDGGEKGRVAKVFMENMRILAMNAMPQRTEDGQSINAAVATIEVTPSEGERLAIAMNQGQIQVMLRGHGEPESVSRPRPLRTRTVTCRAPHDPTVFRDALLRHCNEQKNFQTDTMTFLSPRVRP
jgi:Flp pilus assembly protein CpaB